MGATTLSIKGIFERPSIITLCIEWHYAECRVSFIVLLNAVMVSVIFPNAVKVNVMALENSKRTYNFIKRIFYNLLKRNKMKGYEKSSSITCLCSLDVHTF
jgi:hypothetical protein